MNAATQDAAAPLVEARGLTVSYGRKRAVDDLSFTIPRGRVVACWATTAPARPR